MWVVYILYSATKDTFYIGQTNDIENRLYQHLNHSGSDTFTRRADDWKVCFQLECSTREQAVLIEQHIKRMKSRKYYMNLNKYPEIGIKLLEMYR